MPRLKRIPLALRALIATRPSAFAWSSREWKVHEVKFVNEQGTVRDGWFREDPATGELYADWAGWRTKKPPEDSGQADATIRVKVLALLIVGIHLFFIFQALIALFRVLSGYAFWHRNVKQSSWHHRVYAWFIDVVRLLWLPYAWLADVVIALYTLFDPVQGRKFFAHNESFATGGWAISAPCMQVRSKTIAQILRPGDCYQIRTVWVRLAISLFLVGGVAGTWLGYLDKIPFIHSLLNMPWVQYGLGLHVKFSLFSYPVGWGLLHTMLFIGVGGLLFCALALNEGYRHRIACEELQGFLKTVEDSGNSVTDFMMLSPGLDPVGEALIPVGVFGGFIAVCREGQFSLSALESECLQHEVPAMAFVARSSVLEHGKVELKKNACLQYFDMDKKDAYLVVDGASLSLSVGQSGL